MQHNHRPLNHRSNTRMNPTTKTIFQCPLTRPGANVSLDTTVTQATSVGLLRWFAKLGATVGLPNSAREQPATPSKKLLQNTIRTEQNEHPEPDYSYSFRTAGQAGHGTREPHLKLRVSNQRAPRLSSVGLHDVPAHSRISLRRSILSECRL